MRTLLVVMRRDELDPLRRALHAAGSSVHAATPGGRDGDLALEDAVIDDFDVVVVGGDERLWADAFLLHLLQRAAWEQKLVIGIGAGIVPLGQAGLLMGELSADPGPQARGILGRCGAHVTDAPIVDDDPQIITAQVERAAEVAERILARRPSVHAH